MPETGIVLLVEDNPKILELNRRMLEREGCVVLDAKTLAEARRRLKIADPDVVVLDVMLPDGSGVDFLAELRAVSGAPVLFLTAKSDREDIMAGLAAGGNDYITKPYNIDEFRMRVKGFLNLVGGHSVERQKRKSAYLPDRAREKLELIHKFPMTTVIAPAGYGKTTAARIFADDLPPDSKVFRLNVLSGSVTDFWNDFCKMFSRASKSFSDALLKLGVPADLAAQREFARLAGKALHFDGKPVYVFIDDLHLLSDQGIKDFLLFSHRHLPEHLHIVMLSRMPIFTQNEWFSLSGRINEITDRDLSYSPKDTKTYFSICGCPISDEDAKMLSELHDGWISALYLNMRSYTETGKFSETRDIHNLMKATLYNPLADRAKELLAALSMFVSFNVSRAAFVSEMKDAEAMLRNLTADNNFITQDQEGAYKLHHLFGDVIREAFENLPEERKRHYTRRAGLNLLENAEYIAAERMFYLAGDFESLMLALEKDHGASLTGEHKAEFLTWLEKCPKEILNAHPIAMLICARRLYMYHMRSECAEALKTLKRILAEDTKLSGRERDNLLGEIEISGSFLRYNNIEAMSVCHKRACELMNRPTNAVSPFVPWTYGSPSVFAAYHRKSGEANRESDVLKEAMPYWYRLNRNHGSGAEHLFEGELHFLQGNFTDAIISLHRALHDANQNRQPIMAFAADFLRLRIEAFQGNFDSIDPTLQNMRSVADQNRLFMLQHTADLCECWLYSLAGQPDKAAAWLAEGALASTRLMFPAIHFPHMVYCQLLLARGEYAAMIAREEEERALYRIFPNLLPEIYLDIQLAAAYEQLGRRRTAINYLTQALELATPDQIFMPFVENCNYIIDPMREIPEGIWEKPVEKILALYLQNRPPKPDDISGSSPSAALEALTERDISIARLLATGMSNKEIADELYVSESRIKANLSGIFQKLGISAKKNKRQLLATMFKQ